MKRISLSSFVRLHDAVIATCAVMGEARRYRQQRERLGKRFTSSPAVPAPARRQCAG